MCMINALTIDVEDYFNVSGFESEISYEDWDRYESRVERNTNKILTILNKFNVRATFFALGWIAERYPNLIRDINLEGHEIASHGYAHRLVSELEILEFEMKYGYSFEMFKDKLKSGQGGDEFSYETEKDAIRWEDVLIEKKKWIEMIRKIENLMR